MENNNFTQEQIDLSFSNSSEFWIDYHKSIAAPYSVFYEYKNMPFQQFVNMFWTDNDMIIALNHLFEFPLLKGEYLLTFHKNMFLTNYRLIINDFESGVPIIPLNFIKLYENGVIKYELNSQLLTLKYPEFIKENIVNAAIARNDLNGLNELQLNLISKTFYDLNKEFPNFKIPKVEILPKAKLPNDIPEIPIPQLTDDIIVGTPYKLLISFISLVLVVSAFLPWINFYDIPFAGGFYGFVFLVFSCLISYASFRIVKNNENTVSSIKTFTLYQRNFSIFILVLFLIYFFHFSGWITDYARSMGAAISQLQISLSYGWFTALIFDIVLLFVTIIKIKSISTKAN